MAAHAFQSSGDLTADRRYEFARDLAARGDAASAADVFMQTVELAPEFTAAWFDLGKALETLGRRPEAAAAFREVARLDPQDRHGARLHLMQLGVEPLGDMPAAYVREVFDQYAARFDDALINGLNYRGPELLLAAVRSARADGMRFNLALDLGCGTGLGGAAFRPFCKHLAGVDVSPNMVGAARRRNIYDALTVGGIMEFLPQHKGADLVLAADVFAYFRDLHDVIAACAVSLSRGGLLAFTVETYDGDGVTLGEKLRFAHGAAHVRQAIAAAGLALVSLENASTRNEAGRPVPGLIAVARREDGS